MYRNHLDTYYYKLNPSYESYLLKRCNISLKNSKFVSMYTVGSCASLIGGFTGIAGPHSSIQKFEMFMGTLLVPLSAYLAYCAFNTINNPEYEYELLEVKY